MLIPPRLNRLLCLLLRSDTSVKVSELAGKLGASTRTVFREMEHIDSLLEPYGLQIGTKAGEGVFLAGSGANRKALLEELESIGELEPSDKRERRALLLFELLRQSELQKLYAYANRFRVSEATISGDLEAVAPWLDAQGLLLVRRQGVGVCLTGAEKDFRRALIRLLSHTPHEREAQGMLDPALLDGAKAALRGTPDPRLERMTDGSCHRLSVCLAVAAMRIRAGRPLPLEESVGTGSDDAARLADRLADAAERAFSIPFSPAERVFITVHVSGTRMNYSGGEQELDHPFDQYELQRMAYQLIDRFDSGLAYELKMDETLARGLALHLKSTIVRLRNGMELHDPLLEQVSRSYPEVYEKSCQAARVLEEEYGCRVPDSEVGFLAMHFGAAVMRLRDKKTRKKTVRIGVVCLNGIGVSYMMASQLKEQFRGDVEVEICSHEELGDVGRFDFLVSTFPLRREDVAVIEVHPLLEKEELERVREEVARRGYVQEHTSAPSSAHPLAKQARRMELILQDLQALLEQFDVTEARSDSSFEELSKLTGYRFGNSPEKGKCLYEDLMARERVSTQVIKSYGFVLLHARTEGVERPFFSLIRPEEAERFTDPYLQGVQTVVVMLAPKGGHPDQGRMMGAISSALVEDETFLTAVREGCRDEVLARLEALLRDFVTENLKQI